jgi:hypothetical protein
VTRRGHSSPPHALQLYLQALFGRDPERFVEIAHRAEDDGRKGPMYRGRTGIFRRASELDAIAEEIRRLSRREHVWVGVVPRRPHSKTGELGGKKENVAPARVLWIDCDAPGRDPLSRIRRFRPPPHMIVCSGGGYHAYWLLRETIEDPERLREANERLAFAIGGDRQAADAARILRPPGTRNFKCEYGRPRAVELVCVGEFERYRVVEVVGRLPRPPGAKERSERKARPPRTGDALQLIAPGSYFSVLANATPGRDGKVCCPLLSHDDPEPSCHVYETPAEGWYCFGCGHGGDIYELAGELWGLRREGSQFLELRARLRELFEGERLAQRRVLTARR